MPIRELTREEVDNLSVSIESDGLDIRQLTPQETRGIPLPSTAVTQQQGVSVGTRFTVKNLAANPAAAQRFLETKGFEVRPFGSGFNFAVRRVGSDEKFQVVDPAGFEPQDILDFSFDAIAGTATTRIGGVVSGAIAGALIGGPIGALIGAGIGLAVGGIISEAGRQLLGSALGVPENADFKTIMFVGLASGIAPGVGRTLGAGGRLLGRKVGAPISRGLIQPAKNIAAELAGAVTRIKDRAGLTAGEALTARAALPRSEVIRTPFDVGEDLVNRIALILGHKFPERKAIEKILDASGKTFNLNPTFDRLALIGTSIRESALDAASSQKLVGELSEKIVGVMRVSSTVLENPAQFRKLLTRIPARLTDDIAGRLQKESNFTNDLGVRVINAFTGGTRQAQKILRIQMRKDLGREFRVLESLINQNLAVSQNLQRRIGRMVEALGSDPKAEAFINGLVGNNKVALRRLVARFDRLNNTDFLRLSERAAIGSAFQAGAGLAFGQPSFRPNITVTGGILGLSVASTVLGATGPVALAAAPVGAVLSSQRGVVGTTRALQGLSRAVGTTGRGLARGVNPESPQIIAALQAAVRDSQARRNTVGSRARRP